MTLCADFLRSNRMRLLKFADGDAPQSFANAHVEHNTVTYPGLCKKWVPIEQGNTHLNGFYWLLDDEGKPLCLLNDVLVMRAVALPSATPAPVLDSHVAGVDFKSKIGRALETSRTEYGATYKTNAAGGAIQMNAEVTRAKKDEGARRQRENISEMIEKGEVPEPKKPRKEKSTKK